MTDLTEDEKTSLVNGISAELIPIITKHQITDARVCIALIESVTAGYKLALEQIKEQRE